MDYVAKGLAVLEMVITIEQMYGNAPDALLFQIKFESRRMNVVSIHCEKQLLEANVSRLDNLQHQYQP